MTLAEGRRVLTETAEVQARLDDAIARAAAAEAKVLELQSQLTTLCSERYAQRSELRQRSGTCGPRRRHRATAPTMGRPDEPPAIVVGDRELHCAASLAPSFLPGWCKSRHRF